MNAFWKRRLWREPDAGNLHVRFDEGEGSSGHWFSNLSFHALLSTLLVVHYGLLRLRLAALCSLEAIPSVASRLFSCRWHPSRFWKRSAECNLALPKNRIWVATLGGLPFGAISDILSDMKIFTVRDLDREPGTVLDACDKEGAVRIRRRGGRCYTIRPDDAGQRAISRIERERWLQEHLVWIKRTFPKPISQEQSALVDRLIAGE